MAKRESAITCVFHVTNCVEQKAFQLSHYMQPGKKKSNINVSSYSHKKCTYGDSDKKVGKHLPSTLYVDRSIQVEEEPHRYPCISVFFAHIYSKHSKQPFSLSLLSIFNLVRRPKLTTISPSYKSKKVYVYREKLKAELYQCTVQ